MCLERSIQKCVYITKLENKLIYIYIYIYMNKIITSHFNRIKLKENNNNNNNNNNKGIT